MCENPQLDEKPTPPEAAPRLDASLPRSRDIGREDADSASAIPALPPRNDGS